MKKSEVYSELLDVVKRYNFKCRFDLVSYSIGYYEKVDLTIFEAIEELMIEGVIGP